jgi:hypothetical protein
LALAPPLLVGPTLCVAPSLVGSSLALAPSLLATLVGPSSLGLLVARRTPPGVGRPLERGPFQVESGHA